MKHREIYNSAQLMEAIQEMGFLPLLDSGILGYSAEEIVADDCRYVMLPDGGWDWPLWKWKGPIITEGNCVYGKFFAGKAGFISREWWPDFCNYRRHLHPMPSEGSIEETVLFTLQEQGPLITRELRAACGFNGSKMRSRFDGYVTRLQIACRVITEDFVYPTDKHGNEYGWGWALLTTPEQLHGRESCQCPRTPEESFERLIAHFKNLLPNASDKQILKLLRC
ncbi:MAG: hypothetical protein J6W43_08225 [Prevotella sp.]|nr:hypothetical protein [Prevotella sp.]